MKVVLPLVVDYDLTDWAEEYGLSVAEAGPDLVTQIRRQAVEEGGLAEVVGERWPMMRGHLTAGPLLTDLAGAHALVANLTDAMREHLREALREAAGFAADRRIREVVTEVLAREFPGQAVLGVVFGTMEFDNGHHVHTQGEVFFAEGGGVTRDFRDLEETFGKEFGAVGQHYAVAVGVISRPGEIWTEDAGDEVYGWLGVSVPGSEIA